MEVGYGGWKLPVDWIRKTHLTHGIHISREPHEMSQKIALSTFGSKKCGFIAGSLLHRPGPWSSYNVPLEQVDQCDNFKMRNEITFVVLISDIS